jgi:hypothetical protein
VADVQELLKMAELVERSGLPEAEVKRHPFQQELPQRVFYQDGSVGDW